MCRRGLRLLAATIDGLIAIALMAPVIYGTSVFGDFLHPHTRSVLDVVLGNLFGLAVILALNGYLLATQAQTIGKRAMGLRIVNLDGTNAKFSTIVMRRVLPFHVLATIPIIKYIALIDVLFIFREDRRCLHDHLAGTRVVKIP
jgi:uncharacterized RDD family membrane protein YckC